MARQVWTEGDREVHRTLTFIGMVRKRLQTYQKYYECNVSRAFIDEMTPNAIKFRTALTHLESIADLDHMFRLKVDGHA